MLIPKDSKEIKKYKSENLGGIVPHHDTASKIIDSFSQNFKTDQPLDVIILAPNHLELGTSNILGDNNIYPDLRVNNLVNIDTATVSKEYAITTPASFIKKYLPKAKIIPLIFKKQTSLDNLDKLSDLLTDYLKQGNAIILASVDFSHNLMPQESEKRDAITLYAMRNFDYQKITNLNSEYLDSPQSIIVLLKVMEKLGIEKFRILDHSNSAKILGPSITNTTSYFSVLFSDTSQVVVTPNNENDYKMQKNSFPAVNREYSPESLSLEKIFATDHSWVSTVSAKKVITLVATGDVIPARVVNYNTVTKRDFKWPYLNTALILKSADITLVNLESPLIKGCKATQTGMVFCGDERNIEGLVFAGVDVANLANNHTENYGKLGLDQTQSILEKNGILYSTSNNLAVKEISGVKFGFIGFNVLNPIDEETIASQISQFKNNVDVLVVSFHWGAEYQSFPDRNTINLAHRAVDSGADLVIGNHPHWIQPPEIYKEKLIMYAHGNFIFDQMWSEKTKEGVIGKYTFYNDCLIDAQLLPIYIRDYGQPQLLEGSQKDLILKEIYTNSTKIGVY